MLAVFPAALGDVDSEADADDAAAALDPPMESPESDPELPEPPEPPAPPVGDAAPDDSEPIPAAGVDDIIAPLPLPEAEAGTEMVACAGIAGPVVM